MVLEKTLRWKFCNLINSSNGQYNNNKRKTCMKSLKRCQSPLSGLSIRGKARWRRSERTCFWLCTCFYTWYPFLLSSDHVLLHQMHGMSKTLLVDDYGDTKENHISSCLWCSKDKGRAYIRKVSNITLINVLLLACGDIESCPGPSSLTRNEFTNYLKTRGLKIVHQNMRFILQL